MIYLMLFYNIMFMEVTRIDGSFALYKTEQMKMFFAIYSLYIHH